MGSFSGRADDRGDAAKKSRSEPPNTVAKAKSKGRSASTPRVAREPREVITGSHIPAKLKRYGRTADTVSLVYILDREDLERSGAANVGEALRRLPFAH
jgi:outer membrane cobalamin receptor